MIYLELAKELADELVAEGAARARPRPRGSIIELVVVGATTAATCISLLQGPETVMRFARAVKKLAVKKKPERVVVQMKGPGGSITLLDCDDQTPLEDIAKMVKDGLLN